MKNNEQENVPQAKSKINLVIIILAVLCIVSLFVKIQILSQDKINKIPTQETSGAKIILSGNAYAINLGRPAKRDFWKTSNKMCKKAGMRLPTKEELLKIHFEYHKIPHSGWYWTADGVKNDDDAYRIYFNLETGDATISNWGISDGGDMVLCIKNKI